MIIEKNKVVAIDYTLTDEKGEILDDSTQMGPLEYLHGHANVIPGLEKALEGKKEGDSFKVEIEAKDAYGEFREDLVAEVAKTQFPEDAELVVGMQFEAESPEGTSIVSIINIEDDKVTVSANHPLAGETLFFDVTVKSIRDASDEEIARGGLQMGCGCGGHGSDCGDSCGDGNCGGDSGGCGCGH